MNSLIAFGVIGGTVVLITAAEKKLVSTGKHIEADLIHNITKIVMGCTTLGMFLYVAWQLVQKFILAFM